MFVKDVKVITVITSIFTGLCLLSRCISYRQQEAVPGCAECYSPTVKDRSSVVIIIIVLFYRRWYL